MSPSRGPGGEDALAGLRAQVRALETGPYHPGIMQEIHALYDEIVRAVSRRPDA